MSVLVLMPYEEFKYAHLFRRDEATHVVVTSREKIRRDGKHHTICGKRVDKSFQRLVPFGIGDMRVHTISCPRCSASVVGLMDLMERA